MNPEYTEAEIHDVCRVRYQPERQLEIDDDSKHFNNFVSLVDKGLLEIIGGSGTSTIFHVTDNGERARKAAYYGES